MSKHWTPEEEQKLRQLYPHHTNQELSKMIGRTVHAIMYYANKLKLYKTPEFHEACRRKTYFKKGHVPDNKGKTWDEYLTPEQQAIARRTWYVKGQPPTNYLPVGTEKPDYNGYWRIKVAHPDKWRYKHHMLWEQHNGPIPKGMIVYFRDGNRNNITIENLAIANQRQHANNTVVKIPLEIKQLIQLKAALKRAIKKAEKNEN